MYHFVLMKVDKTFQNLLSVRFDYWFRESALLLINAAQAASRHVLKINTKLVVDYLTADVLDHISMIQFSIYFNLFLNENYI
jgi:hypothetical protein